MIHLENGGKSDHPRRQRSFRLTKGAAQLWVLLLFLHSTRSFTTRTTATTLTTTLTNEYYETDYGFEMESTTSSEVESTTTDATTTTAGPICALSQDDAKCKTCMGANFDQNVGCRDACAAIPCGRGTTCEGDGRDGRSSCQCRDSLHAYNSTDCYPAVAADPKHLRVRVRDQGLICKRRQTYVCPEDESGKECDTLVTRNTEIKLDMLVPRTEMKCNMLKAEPGDSDWSITILFDLLFPEPDVRFIPVDLEQQPSNVSKQSVLAGIDMTSEEDSVTVNYTWTSRIRPAYTDHGKQLQVTISPVLGKIIDLTIRLNISGTSKHEDLRVLMIASLVGISVVILVLLVALSVLLTIVKRLRENQDDGRALADVNGHEECCWFRIGNYLGRRRPILVHVTNMDAAATCATPSPAIGDSALAVPNIIGQQRLCPIPDDGEYMELKGHTKGGEEEGVFVPGSSACLAQANADGNAAAAGNSYEEIGGQRPT